MKILKLIPCLFVLIILASCSSSDGGGGGSDASSFSLNGSQVNLTGVMAQRGDNTFVISADTPDGSSIQLEFNKFGNLAEFSYWEEFDVYKNFQYYKSNYFTFNLISVDESARRVKVSFSGNLYLDENDLTSATKQISGSFDLPYTVTTPVLSGLGLQCKIAGNDWYQTQFWDNGFGNVDRKYISDDDKMIIMQFIDEDIALGTYTFTTSSNNKIQLAKYDTTTNTFTQYNTSGTVTVTSNSFPIFGIRIIEGTYSFTATNPSNASEQIQVTNGAFKTNF